MNNYLDDGATLFTDNFYTSVPLTQQMHSAKQPMWNYSKQLERTSEKSNISQVEEREMSALENAFGIKAFHWKDKRNVYILSTVPKHDDKLILKGTVSKDGVERKKPKSVLAYNKVKKGADISEEMSSYYTALK